MPIAHRGFSAWIQSNNVVVTEYAVTVNEAQNKVSCWIPGVAGQTFTVIWKDHSSGVDTCTFITLDGHTVPGRFLQGSGVASRSGVRTSSTTERPFMFQEILDEGTSGLAPEMDAGIIAVKIKRIRRVIPKWVKPAETPSFLTVIRKRKAGNMCVGFGEDEKVYERHTTTWEVAPYEKDAAPGSKPITFVTFVFRYRSFEFLQSQGIATIEQTEVAAPIDDPPVATQAAPGTNRRPSKKAKVQPFLSVAPVSNPSTASNTPAPSPPISASSSEPTGWPSMPAAHMGPYTPSMATNATANPAPPVSNPILPAAYIGHYIPSMATNAAGNPVPTPHASSAPSPIANSATPAAYMGHYMPSMAINAVNPHYSMPPPMYPMGYMYPGYNVGPNPHIPIFMPVQYSNMAPSASHQPSPVASTSQIPSTSTATPSATTSKAKKPRKAPAPRAKAAVSTSRAASVSSRPAPTTRRTSAETKRAVSWTAGSTMTETVAIGPYEGQSQFFLPRNTLQGSTLMNIPYPDNSGTSESPDTTGEESPI